MEPTTSLEIIRWVPARFTWGVVQKIHEIGRYTIVEHLRRPARNGPQETEVAFHLYVDGKDMSTSAATLDRALLTAVAHGNLECNDARAAGGFAARAMGLP